MRKRNFCLFALASVLLLSGAASCGGSNNDDPKPNPDVPVLPEEETFTIKLSKVEHGTITASKTSGKVGEKITITATPDTGYELVSLTMNGTKITSGAEVSPVKGENTVGATFKKLAEEHPQEEVPDLEIVPEGTKELSLSESVFTGRVEVMGGFDCTLKFTAEGKAKLEFSGQASFLNKEGTVKIVNNVAIVTIAGETAMSSYNALTGNYEIDLPFKGQDANLVIFLKWKAGEPITVPQITKETAEFKGSVVAPFPMNYTLNFIDDVDCTVDFDKFSSMQQSGTYIIKDNVLELTFNGKTFGSYFDYKSGSYKINFVCKTPEGDKELELAWKVIDVTPTSPEFTKKYFDFTGTVKTPMGEFEMNLKPIDDTNCKIELPQVSFLNREGTYVIKDGVLETTFGEDKFVSKYDKEKGFTIEVSISGDQGTFKATLVSKVK